MFGWTAEERHRKFVVRTLEALTKKVDAVALDVKALEAIVAKLVADVPAAIAKDEAEAQARIDAVTAQLTALEAQVVPPAPATAEQPLIAA